MKELLENSFEDTIEGYRRSLEREKENTIHAYCSDIRQLSTFLSTKGVNDWASVPSEHITAYVGMLSEGDRYRPSTIARKYAALKSFFRYLHGKGVITQALLEVVVALGVGRLQPVPPQILSQEQVASLFANVDERTSGGLRDLAMLQILCTSGLLTSEILALNLADIDREGKTLSSGQGAQRRVLPLSSLTHERIQRYLEHGRPLLARSEEPALFINHHGKRLSRAGVWLLIKGYADRIGGDFATSPRILRQTCAVSMLRSGMELDQVQEALGYARSSSLHIYTQF